MTPDQLQERAEQVLQVSNGDELIELAWETVHAIDTDPRGKAVKEAIGELIEAVGLPDAKLYCNTCLCIVEDVAYMEVAQ